MDSVDRLKEMFIDVSLEVEDMFLLEGFQVDYLVDGWKIKYWKQL